MENKIEIWTLNKLTKFLKANPDARLRIDYDRLKKMYPEIDFPDRGQEANDGD